MAFVPLRLAGERQPCKPSFEMTSKWNLFRFAPSGTGSGGPWMLSRRRSATALLSLSMKPRLLFALGALFTGAGFVRAADAVPTPTPGLSLWYEKPSAKWTDALPLGNGRIGAMVYGGVEREHLQLNEDTLYSGEPPADLRTLDITKDFDQVIALIRAGKNTEADAYVTQHWLGRNQQCYQPLGDLWLDFPGDGPATQFRRWLDLSTATAGVSYVRDGAHFTREIFISAPDQVIVIHVHADQP